MKNKLITSFLLFSNLSLFAQWNSNPATNTPICTEAGKQIEHRIISDGLNGAFITWKDYRTGVPDIYIQHINSAGITQWTTNGIGLCTDFNDQSTPAITTDMNGGAIIVWQDSTAVDTDVKAQRMGPDGTLLWQENGVNVGSASGTQADPKSVSDGWGGSIFVFRDKRSGSNDIYAHHLYSNGTTVSDIGISETTLSETNCYPNPFYDRINLKVDISKNDNVLLFLEDILGNKVPIEIISIAETNSTRNYVLEIVSSEISSGVYILKIEGDNSTKSIRLVKY